MGEGLGQMAPGPRSVRESVAPAELDLRSHDWRSLIEQLTLAVYIDRLDETSSNVYTSPQLEAILATRPRSGPTTTASCSRSSIPTIATA